MTENRSVVAWGRGERLWGRLMAKGHREHLRVTEILYIWIVMVVALLYTFVKNTMKCTLKTDEF